ncbi:MAG: hypothetical protein ACXVGA_04260 [Mycobacteriaceae bacterium]
MKIEVRRSRIDGHWQWSCPVCHYGDTIPWETVRYWWLAMAQVETHILEHRTVGQALEWIPIRIPY